MHANSSRTLFSPPNRIVVDHLDGEWIGFRFLSRVLVDGVVDGGGL